MTNHTISTGTAVSLHVLVSYRDASSAIEWLERAIGLTTTMRHDDEHGSVMHAELRRDEIAVIVFDDAGAGYDHPAPRADAVGLGAYVALSDTGAVDAVWASATAAGAVPVWAPEWTGWGNYRCRFRDPEGREWSFGVYRPGRVDDRSVTAS